MHEKKQGKFLEGFFWGGVIGGGFAYLLSTKKGRDFLKDLIQNGVDALDNMTMPETEALEDPPIIEQPTRVEEKPVAHPHTGEQEVKKTRFFKKSPKK